MIMQLLRGLFGKKEEPKKRKAHKRINKQNEVIDEAVYQEVGRFKYFEDMDKARKYIRDNYHMNNISFAVRDLNKKGFRTINGKEFKKENLRWYLQDDYEYEFAKMMRIERVSKNTKHKKEYELLKKGAK